MNSLACSPMHDPENVNYKSLGPFPKRILGALPTSEGDIISAPRGGWQYLIADGRGFAVMDLSAAPTGSFSRVRRGRFAEAYHNALAAMEHDAAAGEESLVVEMLEIAPEFTSAMVMRGASIKLYPISILGGRPSCERMNLNEFVAAAEAARRRPIQY